MTEQTLHRLRVLLLIYEESCEAVAQIVGTEALSRPEHNTGRDSGVQDWYNFSPRQTPTQWYGSHRG